MKKLLLMLMLCLSLLLTACAADEQNIAPSQPQAPPPQETQLADGTQLVTTYHANGTVETETRTYPDGEQGIEQYAEDGTLSALIRQLPDGSYNEEQYRKGELIYRISLNADGHQEEAYYENGVPVSIAIRQSDGSVTVTEFTDGRPAISTETIGDEQFVTRYHADGSIKSSERSVNGRLVQAEYYDAAGRLTESFGIDGEGRPVQRTHHADGSSTSYISNADGTTTQVDFDAKSNVLSSAIVE